MNLKDISQEAESILESFFEQQTITNYQQNIVASRFLQDNQQVIPTIEQQNAWSENLSKLAEVSDTISSIKMSDVIDAFTSLAFKPLTYQEVLIALICGYVLLHIVVITLQTVVYYVQKRKENSQVVSQVGAAEQSLRVNDQSQSAFPRDFLQYNNQNFGSIFKEDDYYNPKNVINRPYGWPSNVVNGSQVHGHSVMFMAMNQQQQQLNQKPESEEYRKQLDRRQSVVVDNKIIEQELKSEERVMEVINPENQMPIVLPANIELCNNKDFIHFHGSKPHGVILEKNIVYFKNNQQQIQQQEEQLDD